MPQNSPKAQATLLPAFSVRCEMENRKQQNRNLQPIHDGNRQGERNQRVFLRAKVIQACSQINAERDQILCFPGQQPTNPNFGQRNNLGLDTKQILL